jgi:ferredoxin-NADP reductase
VRNHPAVVTEIQELAPNVLQITASLQDGFEFEPGQWVNFRFPEGVSRAYTIASAPERPQAIQLCVRLGPGRGSVALKNLKAGAEVAIDGPYRYILSAADFDPLARSGAIVHESGRIETLIERNRRGLTNATIMAVGFDPFLDRVRATLRDLELDADAIITESFGPQP